MTDRDNSDDLAGAFAGARPGQSDPEAKLMLGRAREALLGQGRLPVRIGRFEIDEKLGAGGMGVVYRAKDPSAGRSVALKVVKEDDPPRQKRLLREAHALARVSHPNVVQVYDANTLEMGLYIAMELIDGVPLGDWIKQSRPDRAQILAALCAAGSGLAASHAAGVIHGDFKPANVLVTAEGTVKLVDFGLARLREGDPADADPWITRLTAAGAGTPAYMAPEQLRGIAVDERSDQFAFCVSAFESLTGHRPYKAKSAVDLDREIARGAIDPDALWHLPKRIRTAVLRGLRPQPGQRHESMAALLSQLAAPAAGWGWAVAISAALLVAAIAAVAIITCN